MSSPAILLGCLGAAAALQQPFAAPSSRRAVLGAAAAFAAPWAAVAAKDKGYMTLDEYNKIKRDDMKDSALNGLFDSLRNRAAQTGEFDKLAKDDKMKEITNLALAWDSNIRKDVLEKANDQLSGAAKDKGKEISKTILEDLKKMDKLAKAGSKDDVPATSAALRGHVLEFVALEPQKLVDKYGGGPVGVGETLGDL